MFIIAFVAKSCADNHKIPNREEPIGIGCALEEPEYFYHLSFVLLNLDFNRQDSLTVEIKAVDGIKTIGSFFYLSRNIGTYYKNRLHIVFLPHNNYSSRRIIGKKEVTDSYSIDSAENFVENSNSVVKGKFIEVNDYINKPLWAIFTDDIHKIHNGPDWGFNGYKAKENRKLRGTKRKLSLKVFKNDSVVIFDKNFTVKTEKNLEKTIDNLKTEIFEMQGDKKVTVDDKVLGNSGKNLEDYFNRNPKDIGRVLKINHDKIITLMIYLHSL
ncbi:hypothetical protein JBKA6_0970 [Ichthyobacterium seriolicida]|uniref:Uncharacterized protein n=2 Tax=Ichthyobacterium seriolicida TaxID=242600 RepID=A0A1J1DYK2_9FLAO|nr:hypothetical protein JBKA6_0970 [Ichthyobacterium seriolicida]